MAAATWLRCQGSVKAAVIGLSYYSKKRLKLNFVQQHIA